MKITEFGGNSIKQFQLGKPGKELLGSGPYEYFIYESQENEELCFDTLRSFSCFLFRKPASARVAVRGIDGPLEQGDCVQAEDFPVKLSIQGGSVKILIAGTTQPHPATQGFFLTRHTDIYKVEKPWGHELWINGQHKCYAFKEIFVKMGTKTSLQYHNFKQETNVLFEGTAKLHYKVNLAIANDDVIESDTATVQIMPVSSVDVMPNILHRLEAITDILLYEISTPHLDDVVRVLDDKGRPSGRIEKEHIS